MADWVLVAMLKVEGIMFSTAFHVISRKFGLLFGQYSLVRVHVSTTETQKPLHLFRPRQMGVLTFNAEIRIIFGTVYTVVTPFSLTRGHKLELLKYSTVQ